MSPGGVALLVGAVALLLLTVGTAHRPAQVLDRAGYLRGWSELHGDVDPAGNRFVHGWLVLVHTLARPLARVGVAPDVITLSTVWLAAAVVALVGPVPVAAGTLVVVAALLDGVDGCLAVVTGRSSRHGAVLDSSCDRLAETLWLQAAVLAGCPLALAAAALLAILTLEGVRILAGRVITVTVAEKPTRVIVLAPTLALSAVVTPVIGVAVLLALTFAGMLQLRRARRRSRAS